MEGVTELTAPRSTASQMQRGSGELQSTPTGFWKLQSAPAGAGHGSIAAGIGAWSLLRSTSLTAHIGCSHTHTQGRGPDAETPYLLKPKGRWVVPEPKPANPLRFFSHSTSRNSTLSLPIHCCWRRPFREFNPARCTSQLPGALTHIHPLTL